MCWVQRRHDTFPHFPFQKRSRNGILPPQLTHGLSTRSQPLKTREREGKGGRNRHLPRQRVISPHGGGKRIQGAQIKARFWWFGGEVLLWLVVSSLLRLADRDEPTNSEPPCGIRPPIRARRARLTADGAVPALAHAVRAVVCPQIHCTEANAAMLNVDGIGEARRRAPPLRRLIRSLLRSMEPAIASRVGRGLICRFSSGVGDGEPRVYSRVPGARGLVPGCCG